MLRSGIPFPFPTFFHHFATLKDLPFDTIIEAILQDLLFSFLPFYHRWWKTWVVYGLPHGFDYPGPAWGTIKTFLSNLQTWNETPFQQFFFFKDANFAIYFYHFLPACSHSQPLAATFSHLQPLDWLQVAAGASGRKRPLKQVHGSHLQPLPTTRVAASGRSRQFQASGRKWPLRNFQQVAASGRPSQFQASGRKWPQVAAFGQINFQPQSNRSGKMSPSGQNNGFPYLNQSWWGAEC